MPTLKTATADQIKTQMAIADQIKMGKEINDQGKEINDQGKDKVAETDNKDKATASGRIRLWTRLAEWQKMPMSRN